MLSIVNAVWLPGEGLGLWFEATSLADLRVVHRPQGASWHPYSFEAKPFLIDVLSSTRRLGILSPDTVFRLTLRLPSYAEGLPKPSQNNWIDLEVDQAQKSGLSLFDVTLLILGKRFTIDQFMTFYDMLFVKDSDASQVLLHEYVASPSMEYLREVAGFTHLLYRNRQVIPAIERDESSGDRFGKWRTLLGPQDVTYVAQLAMRMPTELRSWRMSNRKGEKSPSALFVLRNFIDSLMDSTLRADLADAHASLEIRETSLSSNDMFLNSLIEARFDEVLPGRETRIFEVLSAWRERALTHLEPAHLALRLYPPGFESREDDDLSKGLSKGDDQDEWFVELGLQPIGNREAFYSASDIFSGDKTIARSFNLTNKECELLLLRKVRSACAYSSELRGALTDAQPKGFFISTADVISFVAKTGTVLADQEAVGIVVPAALRERLKPRVSVSAAPVRSKSAALGLDTLFSFETKVYLGEREVTLGELKGLLSQESSIAKIGDEWVMVDRHQIQAAIKVFQKKMQSRQGTLREFFASSVVDADFTSLVEIERPDPRVLVESVALSKMLGAVQYAHPSSFLHPLRDYQHRGVEWMMNLERIGFGACLADDMGLGKTAQVIALLAQEHENRLSLSEYDVDSSLALGDVEGLPAIQSNSTSPIPTNATLVVAPVSVVNNWRREIAHFYPELSIYVHHGADRLEDVAFVDRIRNVEVVITSYSLLGRDIDLLSTLMWNRVVLDEAQNIKNPMTIAAQGAFRLASSARLALTGTPVENHTGELWSIMNFLNPGLLGSRGSFRKHFSVPIERDKDELVANQLASLVSPFIMRRMKSDKTIIADLPEKIETKEYCSLTTEQIKLYQRVLYELEERIAKATAMERRGLILASITKLKQLCNHPAQLVGGDTLEGRSGKLDRLVELLEEIIQAGEKAIVFTQFVTFGSVLQGYLQDHFHQKIPFLKGDVPIKVRDAMVTDFQDSAGSSIFLLSLKAGGTGLNLTAANHVIHFDRWWNSAVETQATDRAFRIGQRKNVMVTKMIAEGTLEEKIDAIIDSKAELASKLISTGEVWITEMADDEVLEILSLGPSMGDL